MADRITIAVQNLDLTRTLDRAVRRVKDTRGLMAHVGAAVEMNINLRLINKRDPDGAAWAPLAPSTIARKLKKGQTTRILEATGLMQQSLGYSAGQDWVEVGVSEPYGIYHETGTRRMPRRGFLFADHEAGQLGRDDQEEVELAIAEYLAGSLAGW
ncbi:phage virion morphogenesis protein [Piscinibacter koreensis]|uniref:Phage virion morphogenesis protein n=1 Tax=Piscinibacter koreensis TaxID=2742824 RepID=A0A7Y6NTC2_9BURK|nr:phage virion morphogenesis protein [Schlegelella koreensis]NUZ08940.1 phage virion morphogenesis protein [Schlegelella koreensis]